MLLVYSISIPLGIRKAVRDGSRFDAWTSGLIFVEVESVQGRGSRAVPDAVVRELRAEVERCIGAKIRTWKFPKPKGGGIVIVRYPFVFKRTG